MALTPIDFKMMPWRGKVKLSSQEFDRLIHERSEFAKAREMLGIELSNLKSKRFKGNEYQDYGTAVKAIEDKYNSKAEWGCILTGNIVDLRAAFIIGQGLQVVTTEGVSVKDAEAELKFVKDFFEFNKLDKEMPVELAKEAEIEGKIALKVSMEDSKDFKDGSYPKMVSVRYLSWIQTKYKVITEKDDYLNYVRLEWVPTKKTSEEKLEKGDFVYNKFGGRIVNPNEAQPKVMKCLTQIDDVDKAYRDWREINHLFSSPIFDVECEDKNSVEDANKAFNDYRMNINKAFVHSGSKLTMASPSMGGVDSLKNEATEKIKVISGTTGIPVHFLGLLDLLKNRATGDNTRELVIAGTEKERIIWKASYKELIDKAMRKFNGESKKGKLDPSKIDIEIPVYTQEQWDHIEKVLMPMYLGGGLSLESLLSQVPGVNMEVELDRLGMNEKVKVEMEGKEAEIRSLKMENDTLRNGIVNKGDLEGDIEEV